jgi:hypothetical protein
MSICWFNSSYSTLSEFIDPGLMFIQVSNKAYKTIGPPGKPEGNTTHIAVSPKITLMGGCSLSLSITITNEDNKYMHVFIT